MLKGIDFASGNGLTIAEIKAGGYQFVCRYLTGTDGNAKDINAAELNDYLAAGMPVVFVFETTGLMPSESQGVADAKAAEAQLKTLSTATGRSDLVAAKVFFAADSATPGNVIAYMKGVVSVIGKGRAGIYGGYASVKAAFDAGVCSYGWQTEAWSNGQWESRALIRQIHNGIKVGPADADLDQAAYWTSATILGTGDDFGQFPAPASAPRVGPTRHVSDGKTSLHAAAEAALVSVEAVVASSLKHCTEAEIAALTAYLGLGNWKSLKPARSSGVGANGVMPKGLVAYWIP